LIKNIMEKTHLNYKDFGFADEFQN